VEKAVVAAKNHERKILLSSFIDVVLVVGQDPGRKEEPKIWCNLLTNEEEL
jgi:hypothetical protein